MTGVPIAVILALSAPLVTTHDRRGGASSVSRTARSYAEAKEARAGGRGGSWLRAMAEVLGAKLDASANEMRDLVNRVSKDDPSTTTDFNVVSQELNMLMSAATTAIKTSAKQWASRPAAVNKCSDKFTGHGSVPWPALFLELL